VYIYRKLLTVVSLNRLIRTIFNFLIILRPNDAISPPVEHFGCTQGYHHVLFRTYYWENTRHRSKWNSRILIPNGHEYVGRMVSFIAVSRGIHFFYVKNTIALLFSHIYIYIFIVKQIPTMANNDIWISFKRFLWGFLRYITLGMCTWHYNL